MPVHAPELHQMLLDAGLGRVADAIEREARPSIRLTAHPVEDEETIPLGASKLGGSPDLPPGFEWPRHQGIPLALIAQINLAETTPYDIERLLPTTGILYFFFSYDHWGSTYDQEGVWRIFFHPGESKGLQRLAMPEPRPDRRDLGGPCDPFIFHLSVEATLAHYASFDQSYYASVAPLTEEEEFALIRVEENLAHYSRDDYRTWVIHRMLGHYDPVQGVNLPPDDVLLLQVDSQTNDMMWGDVGRLYFILRREELAKRDFTQVRLLIEDS